MREIKFRVWNERDSNYTTWDEYKTNNLADSGCDRIYDVFFHPIINGDLLEQYTGLKDKNGVDIYEGDVVKGYKCHFQIKFINGAFMWGDDLLGYDIEQEDGESAFIEECDCNTLEIIGNVHENPELL